MLQPGSVRAEARLAADLGRLRDHCAALEEHGLATPARDFADLLLEVCQQCPAAVPIFNILVKSLVS